MFQFTASVSSFLVFSFGEEVLFLCITNCYNYSSNMVTKPGQFWHFLNKSDQSPWGHFALALVSPQLDAIKILQYKVALTFFKWYLIPHSLCTVCSLPILDTEQYIKNVKYAAFIALHKCYQKYPSHFPFIYWIFWTYWISLCGKISSLCLETALLWLPKL